MRNDVHAPSNIQPNDYLFVGQLTTRIEGLGDCLFIQQERKVIEGHMQRTGGNYATHAHGGSCHICGAFALYLAVFYHEPSNEYIKTGQDCATKLDMGERSAFQSFRKAVRAALGNIAGKAKAQMILAEHDLDALWPIYDGGWKAEYEQQEEIVIDIVGKLVRYGNLSERQIAFLARLEKQIVKRPEIKARWQAEKDAAEPVPEGRQQVSGIVVKRDWQENDFGGRPVWTVKDDRGFAVWGTVPDKIAPTVSKGDRVSFVATLTQSDTDSKFGFAKRPAKVEIAA